MTSIKKLIVHSHYHIITKWGKGLALALLSAPPLPVLLIQPILWSAHLYSLVTERWQVVTDTKGVCWSIYSSDDTHSQTHRVNNTKHDSVVLFNYLCGTTLRHCCHFITWIIIIHFCCCYKAVVLCKAKLINHSSKYSIILIGVSVYMAI